EPLTAFEVVRVRRMLRGGADLGAMMTVTTRAEPTEGYPLLDGYGATPSQLCPDGSTRAAGARCFHDAYVGAVDGHWRSRDGDYALSGQVVASLMGPGAPVTFHDGTEVRAGDVDVGAAASATKQGGEHWVGNADYLYEGKKLDFDDLGFMGRQNQHVSDLGVEYRTLTPWWKTLETHTRLDVLERYNTAGLNLAHSYQLGTSARFSSFWSTWLAGYWRPAHFDDREVGDGTTLERAGLVGVETSQTTDPRARLSMRTWAQAQALSDGWQVAADVALLWHALAPLDVELEPEVLFAAGEPRFAGNGALHGHSVFGNLAARNLGATLRATYTFTPRLTLQAYAQIFVASGHYTKLAEVSAAAGAKAAVVRLTDLHPVALAPPTNPDFEQAALNVNLVARWEFALGSTLFAVYTRTQVPTVPLSAGEPASLDFGALRRSPTVDAFVLKLSYWWG
ncbi:MAG: DUF5916 domain-containing protein, partial [Myxococcota bacterium]|nr:DUF5916 domain-containing protein [Myxococcota bacterium]